MSDRPSDDGSVLPFDAVPSAAHRLGTFCAYCGERFLPQAAFCSACGVARPAAPSVDESVPAPHPFAPAASPVAESVPAPHPFTPAASPVAESVPAPHPFTPAASPVAESVPPPHPFTPAASPVAESPPPHPFAPAVPRVTEPAATVGYDMRLLPAPLRASQEAYPVAGHGGRKRGIVIGLIALAVVSAVAGVILITHQEETASSTSTVGTAATKAKAVAAAASTSPSPISTVASTSPTPTATTPGPAPAPTTLPPTPAASPVAVDEAKVDSLLKRIYSSHNTDLNSLIGLGDVYLAGAEYESAIIWYEAVLGVDPKNQLANARLSLAKERMLKSPSTAPPR